MNCVNWYVAFQFCTWDGGRLRTEAEWETQRHSSRGCRRASVPVGERCARQHPRRCVLRSYDCLGDFRARSVRVCRRVEGRLTTTSKPRVGSALVAERPTCGHRRPAAYRRGYRGQPIFQEDIQATATTSAYTKKNTFEARCDHQSTRIIAGR